MILPPYFAIIPMFGGFADRVRPDLSAARLRACGRHFAWAALFGALRGAMGAAEIGADDLVPPAWACWKFVANVLDVATLAHVMIPLLLLHGIEERLPLLRPLFATRIVQFWQRFGVHQKDAQVFLFYTPDSRAGSSTSSRAAGAHATPPAHAGTSTSGRYAS